MKLINNSNCYLTRRSHLRQLTIEYSIDIYTHAFLQCPAFLGAKRMRNKPSINMSYRDDSLAQLPTIYRKHKTKQFCVGVLLVPFRPDHQTLKPNQILQSIPAFLYTCSCTASVSTRKSLLTPIFPSGTTAPPRPPNSTTPSLSTTLSTPNLVNPSLLLPLPVSLNPFENVLSA